MTDILAGLTPEQRDAAEALHGPVLIKAGPGSGKTRTITHRIAHGVASGRYEAHRTLAVTFTARAAAELHARLAALGAPDVAVRTFHSAALRQLRHFWADAIGGTPARIESQRTTLLASAAERLGQPHDRDSLSALLTELDWIKAQGLTAQDYPAVAGQRPATGVDPERVAAVLAEYERVKSDNGVMDFDDVLLVTIGLLESRSDIRESVRRAFRWITVDEYQDVSPLQQRLLDLWVGDRDQICVVGDAAQTIYEFAGADPALLATFASRHPGATVVELSTTFRCAPAIAEVANRLGGQIPGALTLHSAPLPEPKRAAGAAQVLQFPTDVAEAAGIADEIAGLVRAGHPIGEIAVLYRVHLQARILQDELRRREIPFATRGGDRFFERREATEAVTRFRGEVRARPDAAAVDLMTDVLAAMGHGARPPEGPLARERWETLAALAGLFADTVSGADALAELQRRVADNEAPPPAGVSLLTLHAAKGLEWDTVFLLGMDDQHLPFVRAGTTRAEAEERRLMYVGVTRPRHRLVATWAGTTARGGRARPSPYLAAFGSGAVAPVVRDPASVPIPAADETGDHAGAGLPPARCRLCGRALVTGQERVLMRCDTCPDMADERLLGELFAWRDAEARRAGVPSHVVATDATVRAIAEVAPTVQSELQLIPGMRPDRVQQYGRELLQIVTAHRTRVDPRP
jgi:DNA helicase-2/ATP-dependent DNA helicase PcrA